MEALRLVHRRVVLAEDGFVDLVVWRVPEPLRPCRHLFKYRLAYVVAGQCVLRYDNEPGKGDHRHQGNVEEAYEFTSPQQLLADFEADVRRWNDAHGRP